MRLSRAVRHADGNALIAVWWAWLAVPDHERLWSLLALRLEPQSLAEAAFAGAAQPYRSAESRAAIGAFCARHGLAPAGQEQRALFYVLTGQLARHIADDPRGIALTLAYEHADEATRRALRIALFTSADLDLVTVVAGTEPPRDINSMTSGEREFVFGWLAARHDWDRLWRLVRDLPAVAAVAAMRWFEHGWAPEDDAQRAQFVRLHRSHPYRIDAIPTAVSRIRTLGIDLGETPTRGCFSPDGRQLLLATEREGRYTGCRVLDAASGEIVERHDYVGDLPPVRVIHLGASYLVLGQRRLGVWELVRYAQGRAEVLYWSREKFAVARTCTGFAILANEISSRERTWSGPGRTLPYLYRCDGEGRVIGRQAAVSVPAHTPGHRLWLESDPSGRRLALGPAWRPRSVGTLLDSRGRRPTGLALPLELVPRQRPRGEDTTAKRCVADVSAACFTALDRVVVVDDQGRIMSCRTDPSGVDFEPDILGSTVTRPAPRRDLGYVPRLDVITVFDARGHVMHREPNRLSVFRMVYPPMTAEDGSMLCVSPDSRCVAVGDRSDGGGSVTLHWDGHRAQAAILARRPLAELTQRDLAAIAAGARDPQLPRDLRPLLELVRNCLTLRFGGELEPEDTRP
jgi:hypothetical protein